MSLSHPQGTQCRTYLAIVAYPHQFTCGTGVHLEDENGRPHYHIPCTAPNWPDSWNNEAAISVRFNEKTRIEYKGNTRFLTVIFKQAVFKNTLTSGGAVIVAGVGFDKSADYSCVFKYGSSQKQTKTTKPDSTSSINCGAPPVLVSSSYSGSTKIKVSLFVTTAKVSSKEGVKFEGAPGADKFEVDLCTDGAKDGSETDVDCGGKCAAKCGSQKGCKSSSDCTSGWPCTGGKCRAVSCKGLYQSGIRKSGPYEIVDTATNKANIVYCSLTDNAEGRGWTGGFGQNNENLGWFHLDTCKKSWNVGASQSDCLGYLSKPTPRSHEKMLPWYKSQIKYATTHSSFNAAYSQKGSYQIWTVPADAEVEFKVYGASGTICTWVQRRSNLGKGGLAQGKMKVKKGDKFYFIVGQKGRPGTYKGGGWGGGGYSWTTGGPGGASGSGGSR